MRIFYFFNLEILEAQLGKCKYTLTGEGKINRNKIGEKQKVLDLNEEINLFGKV